MRKTRPRAIPIRKPDPVSLDYFRSLRTIVRDMHAAVGRHVLPHLRTWVEAREQKQDTLVLLFNQGQAQQPNEFLVWMPDERRRRDEVQVACVAAFRSDGRFLIQRRRDSGRWCLPGGHLMPHEPSLDAAKREFWEETGLVGHDFELLGVREGAPAIHCYRCLVEGKPTAEHDPDREATAFAWVNAQEIGEFSWARRQDAALSFLGIPTPIGPRLHLDAAPVFPRDAVHRAATEVARKWTRQHAREVIDPTLTKALKATRENAASMMRQAAGIEVPMGNPKLTHLTAGFVHKNVELISSIPKRYFSQVEDLVTEAVHSGRRWEDLGKKLYENLDERADVAESRCALIARDQVGKVFEQMNRARFGEVGVEEGIWRGVRDNRERDEHWDNEGESFDLDGGGIDGVMPGEEVNCRCWTEPKVQLGRGLSAA